uniref:BTB/POZ domain-containing protein KCTD2 n=1 Tax=Aceria tosichella TaxID=561515 RepID=A0A6G1SKZ8_9ACAR
MNLNYVRFDVGHYLHVCHRNTIEKFPNSSLINYIKPEFDTRKSELDYIVIDRDGKHFGTILNFMRDQRSLHLNNWTKDDITDLMTEADYYCLTELIELCDQHLNDRETRESNDPDDYRIPKNRKVEMVFDIHLMRELLLTSKKRVIVASFKSIRRYHIESWLEKLVKFCDFSKVNFYCLADKTNEPIICDQRSYNSGDFLLALYDPERKGFIGYITAPTDERFRSKRYRYKTKLLTFCFCSHNENFCELMKSP